MRNVAALSASILALSCVARADVPAKVTYADHVLPIFRNACLNCHNPDKKKAGLDLTTYEGALQGSENGKVLESGNPGGSLLFKCVKQTEDPKMPPKGDKLTDAELAIVEKWIAGQLLESANGKVVAASKNNVQVAVVSLERPAGPPPMPGELPLEPVVRTTHTNALVALGASPWAPLVAIGGQKQIILYNTDTLEPLGILPFPEGFPAIVRFSRNGQVLLTGGGLGGKSGKVVLWDIKTGDRIAAVGNEFDQVLAADLSPDQQFIALGGPNKLVKIYATKDGRLVTSIKKHTDWVTAIAYSPDGKFLASADRNGGLMVWEGNTGKEFNALPGHKVMITGLGFMNGVVASASEDGKVALWDVKEAKEIKSWVAHKGGAQSVDFTPDGRLVSCGRDKVARVWDQTGKQLMASEEFGDIALRAEIAGERVIAGDWTGEVRVWSLADGKRVGQLTANPQPIAQRLSDAQKELAEAQLALTGAQQQFAAIEEKVSTEKLGNASANTLPPEQADASKKIEQLTAELATLRETRATKQADTPEYKEADAKVQAKKAEIAAAQAAVGTLAQNISPAAAASAKATPENDEAAKAKAGMEQASTRLVSAKAAVEKWTRAQAFMSVHTAKDTVAAKQARHEELVAMIKDALAPAEKAQNDLAAAEKALAAAPELIKEREKALAEARLAVLKATEAAATADAEFKQKDADAQSLTDGFNKAAAAAAELTKKTEQQNAEVTKLRELRETKAKDTPEFAEADGKVQAKKAEIAETQAALEAAQGKTKELLPLAGAGREEAARLKGVALKAHAEMAAVASKVTVAEKALADARKAAERTAATIAKLQKDAPEIATAARATKAQAERDLVIAARELQAAKAAAEAANAQFQANWRPMQQSASADSVVPKPQS